MSEEWIEESLALVAVSKDLARGSRSYELDSCLGL